MERAIVYIHGAFSSSLSFIRIRERLPKHNAILIEYTVDKPIQEVIDSAVADINSLGCDVDVVSHSLGGVIAISSAHRTNKIKSVVTLGTPFGGSVAADTLKWFSTHELYQSCHTNSPVLKSLHKTPLPCPVRGIVTTMGNNPVMYEPNDGVVSVRSQMALRGVEIVKVPLNHFEVLIADVTVRLIREFIFK